MNKVVIPFKYIVEIQRLLIREFELLDTDGRGVGQIRKSIEKYLNLITDNKEYQWEIEDCIYKASWCQNDYTYKPINDLLRANGYEITGETE